MVDKNTLQSHSSHPKLTKVQEEVLYDLMNNNLTPVQIASRRRTSRQNINQIINKIRKKGYLSNQNYNALQNRGGVTVSGKKSVAVWRFHNLHFVIKPFYFEPRYHKWRLTRGNVFYSGDWRFVLHEDLVEMQVKEFVDFVDVSKFRCVEKMFFSFNKFLTIEANRYGFHVFKDGKCNVRICNQHLEQSNSGLAKGRKDDSYVSVRGVHDNKVYFIFDKSKGFRNHEYVHSDLAVSDSEKFEPFFNSIRYNDCYLPHEVKVILDTILDVQKEYAVNIKLHLEVLGEIRDALKEFRRGLE